MTDKRQFFKHTLIFGVGGIIGQLVPFCLLPLYTNYLTPSEYGILDLISMASGVINTIFLMQGVRLASMAFYKQAESEEARRRVAVTISLLLLFVIAIAVNVSVYFVDYIEFFLQTGERDILAFGLSITLWEALVGVPMTLTQARLESLRFVLTNLTMGFSRLGLCIFFVAGLEWGILGVLYAQAIVILGGSIYLISRELWIGSLFPDTTKWKELLLFCLPLVPSGILTFIYGASGRVAVLNIGPYESTAALGAVGLYALARRLAEVSQFMGVAPMLRVWDAEMYDVYKRPEAPYVFGNFMLRLLCVKVFAVLLISIFSTEIVRTLCASDFHGGASLIPLFGIYAILAHVVTLMNKTFFITRKTNYSLYSVASRVPFVLFFMYLFVPLWGITGAALAYIVAYVISIGIVYLFSQRLFRIRYPFGKIVTLMILAILCYFLSLLCGSGIEANIMTAEDFAKLSRWEKIIDAWNRIQWLSNFAKVGVMLLWGVLIWFSGVLLPDDKALVIRVFKRGLQKLPIHRQ